MESLTITTLGSVIDRTDNYFPLCSHSKSRKMKNRKMSLIALLNTNLMRLIICMSRKMNPTRFSISIATTQLVATLIYLLSVVRDSEAPHRQTTIRPTEVYARYLTKMMRTSWSRMTRGAMALSTMINQTVIVTRLSTNSMTERSKKSLSDSSCSKIR